MIKIVLVPYLIVSVTTFLLLTITALAITEIIKAKYDKETIKKWSSNNGVFGTIYSYLKMLIVSFTPIIQIAIIYICMTKKDEALVDIERKIEHFIETGEKV